MRIASFALFICVSLHALPAEADLILYTIDSTNSSLTFSGIVTVPNPLGAGTLPLQVFDQHLLRSTGDLVTRLGGSFTADPVANILGTGFPISQLDPMQAQLRSAGVPVGQMSIPLGLKLDFLLFNNDLQIVNGGVNYSVLPPFNRSGTFGLGGAILNLEPPVFNGSSSVTIPISFSGLIPTGDNNFVLNGTFSGQISAVSNVPEPSSMYLFSVVGAFLGCWRWRHPARRRLATAHRRNGFTLIEICAVLSIVSILMSLLIPVVFASREASRKAICLGHLNQIGKALNTFQFTKQAFPSGRDATGQRNHSWSTLILPYVEQNELYAAYDFKSAWNDSSGKNNSELAHTRVSLYQCPSSSSEGLGRGDYGGNYGTLLTGLRPGFGKGESWSAGILLAVDRNKPTVGPVRLCDIRDGCSSTILVAEDAGLDGLPGMWANGNHNFATDTGGINANRSQEIFSDHSGGANGLFCDGSTKFLSQQIDLKTLGALCTRDQREIVKDQDYLHLN